MKINPWPIAALFGLSSLAFAAGDPARGHNLFRACAVCHSLEPGLHMTGPSLAKIWGREAGSAEAYVRYSDALKKSGIVWNEKNLDAWLRAPQALVPGNLMNFPGIEDGQARDDLVAFLREVSAGRQFAPMQRGGGMMMGVPRLHDLKALGPDSRVTAIRHCRDSYFVTLADGETISFWEFNLRFKTDGSARGPEKGKPVLIGAGMRGDRAAVIFASPEEIGRAIKKQC